MKKLSKVIKDQILTEKDFRESLKDVKIKKFVDMLSNNMYGFRVKTALYQAGKISAKGLLFGDNIFNLPLGKKSPKGEIMIDNDLLAIFDRFLLTEEMSVQGDALTAFMVDHDDSLYQVIKANKTAEVKMSDQEYIQIFSRAYNTTSDIIVENKISALIASDEELGTAMEDMFVEQEEKLSKEIDKEIKVLSDKLLKK